MPFPPRPPPYVDEIVPRHVYSFEHVQPSNQFILGISRGQGDLHSLHHLSTLLNDFDVPNHVLRRAVSTSNEPREGSMRGSAWPSSERPNSAPVVGLGQFCSYVHPVYGTQCNIWYSEDKMEEYHIHSAQHYIEEMRYRAQCTIALSEKMYSWRVFHEVREVRFICCSCGQFATRQMNNVTRLFLHDPEFSGHTCRECSLLAHRARPYNNNEFPPPYGSIE